MRLLAIARPGHYWMPAIRQVFKGDGPLLVRYHIAAPCHLNAAVADTYLALKTGTTPDFVFYGLYPEDSPRPVGMVGVEPGSNFLVTFGLSLPFRTAAGVQELALLIRNLLDRTRPACCVLYERNLPAQRFLRRLGFVAQPGTLTHPSNQQPGILFTLTP